MVFGARADHPRERGRDFEPSIPVLRIQGARHGASATSSPSGRPGSGRCKRQRALAWANVAGVAVAAGLMALLSRRRRRGRRDRHGRRGGRARRRYGYALMHDRPGLRPSLKLLPRVALATAVASLAWFVPVPDVVIVVLATVLYVAVLVAVRGVPDEVWAAVRPYLPGSGRRADRIARTCSSTPSSCVQRQHVRPVARRAGPGRSWTSTNSASMPTAAAARARCGTYSRWPPEAVAEPAGQLHAVRGVEDDRVAERAHLRQRAEVDDEVVVAEGRAALGEQDPAPRRPPRASRPRCAISGGERNWPFLTLTARPVAGGGHEQVGLAAEERRDLQHVDDLGRRARPATTRGCR